MNHLTLSIIILNWNTADLLHACLQSVYQNISFPIEVIVVDNASSDESVKMVKELFPQATLLPQSDNMGYSKGNNVGLDVAIGNYLLLLNPDTEVLPNGLEPLIQFMEENADVGMAGPTLLNPDGTHQPSAAALPTLKTEFLRQTMLFRLFPNALPTQGNPHQPHPVESVTGAALCVRRSCLEQVGPLDPHIFMFYEDTDWCKRAKDHGWAVWFVPTNGVMHVKAAASSRFARTRTLLDSQRSTIYYFRKHNQTDMVIFWLRIITFLGSIMRTLRALLLWVRNRDRADQIARVQAYGRMFIWAVLKRGL